MKACKICKRIVSGKSCPVCNQDSLTSSHQGIVVVFDPESHVAKKLEITAPGKYALKA